MSQDLYQAFMVMINFAALVVAIIALVKKQQLKKAIQWLGRLLSNSKENGKDKIEMIPFSAYFP